MPATPASFPLLPLPMAAADSRPWLTVGGAYRIGNLLPDGSVLSFT